MQDLIEKLGSPFLSKAQFELEIMHFTNPKNDTNGRLEDIESCRKENSDLFNNKVVRFLTIFFGTCYFSDNYKILLKTFYSDLTNKLDVVADSVYKVEFINEKTEIIEAIQNKLCTVALKYNIEYNDFWKFNTNLLIMSHALMIPMQKVVQKNPLSEIKTYSEIKPFCEKIAEPFFKAIPKDKLDSYLKVFEKYDYNIEYLYYLELLYILSELLKFKENLKKLYQKYIEECNIFIGFDCPLSTDEITIIHHKMSENNYITSDLKDFKAMFSKEPFLRLNPIKWLINKERGGGDSPANKTALYSFLSKMLNNNIANKDLKKASDFFIDVEGNQIKELKRPKPLEIFVYGFESFFTKYPTT